MSPTATADRPRLAAVHVPSSTEQLLAAQRIIDALPEHGLTVGEGLSILAVALEAIGVLEVTP